MRSEKHQNKEAYQKLETLAYLPGGIQFNQAAVWNKLEGRLQQSPKKRNFRWVYAAAVWIGLVFATLYFLPGEAVKKNASPVSKKYPGKAQPELAPLSVIATGAKPYAPSAMNKRSAKAPASPMPPATVVSPSFKEEAEKVPAVETAPMPSLTEPTTVATEPVVLAAPRSRFRVAHINELRIPVIPAEVLNDRSKNAYTFLGKGTYQHATTAEEKADEQNIPIKKPKSLLGIFTTTQ